MSGWLFAVLVVAGGALITATVIHVARRGEARHRMTRTTRGRARIQLRRNR